MFKRFKIKTKLLVIFIFISFLISIYLSFALIFGNFFTNIYNNNYKLSVIVPFKDAFEELLIFIPHLYRFLNRQKIFHSIYIINQVDHFRFNRASLINVGYLLTKNESDYFAMHDVDLLPLNDQLIYKYPNDGPYHVSAPHLHPKYHYERFIGGVLLLKNEHFEQVNGFSNRYWGWGLEDDEFFFRLKDAGLKIYRPNDIKTGINDTFVHIHSKFRKRDYARILNQNQITKKRDRQTGLSDVKFELIAKNKMIIDDAPCTVISVELICDYNLTPWCDFSLVQKKKKEKQKS